MKNKICFVTTGNIAQIATAKRALGLADHLDDLGWSVFILMLDCEENRHRVNLECSSNIRVCFFPNATAVKERQEKEELIKQINPSVIYYCALVGRNLVGKCNKAIKLVEHSELQSKFQEAKNIRQLYYYYLENYSILFADGILNASHYLQNVYKHRAKRLLRSKLPMLLFPYAYNEKVCYHDEKLIFEKKPEEHRFVFMGSLTENYGAFIMLEAFEKVIMKDSNVKLYLYGKGRDYNRVVEYIEHHKLGDNIFAPGYINEEDVAADFTAADAFLLPLNDTTQDWARCPSKLYMYLAYDKPVITCKIGEPYAELGDLGYYYDPTNSDSLAEAIKHLIKEGRSSLGVKDSKAYEWKQRAIDLDNWIKSNFKNRLK